MRRGLSLLRISIAATLLEHVALAVIAVASVLIGGQSLPLLTALGIPVTAQVACACLLATTLISCLAPVLPGADDVPRPPQPVWVLGRVVAALLLAIVTVLATAAAGSGDVAMTSAFLRNAAALCGLALVLSAVHPWLGAMTPWVWFGACVAVGVQRGVPAGWATLLRPPGEGWVETMTLLVVGCVIRVAREMFGPGRRNCHAAL